MLGKLALCETSERHRLSQTIAAAWRRLPQLFALLFGKHGTEYGPTEYSCQAQL